MKFIFRSVALLGLGLGVFACSGVGTPHENAGSSASALEAPELIDDVEAKTGCGSIVFVDDSEQPKHPNLTLPPPSGWKERDPAFGLPRDNLTPTDCVWKKNSTQASCTTTVDGKEYDVECKRHIPGGKADPAGAECRVHCYFYFGRPGKKLEEEPLVEDPTE